MSCVRMEENRFERSHTATFQILFDCYMSLKGWSNMSEDDKRSLLRNVHRLFPEQQERLRKLNSRKRHRSDHIDQVVNAPSKKEKIVIDLTGDDDGEEAEFVVPDDSLCDDEKELHELLEGWLDGFDDAYVDSVVPKEDFVVFDNDFHCQEFALGAAAF